MDNEQIAYLWKPITDLPSEWKEFRNAELYSLAAVWSEQHMQLKQSRSLQGFNERLVREWAIETGILERLYTLDRGVTQLLIEQGLDASLIPHGATNIPTHELIDVLKDHRDALEGLFDFVRGQRPLSLSYIRELHQAITRSQTYVDGVDQFGNPTRRKFERGQWKKDINNPTRPDGSIHEYCPPVHVPLEMEKLVEFFNNHQGMPPEINAAWLHHRFTQIHPFQDGNGRVARALATIVFLQAGWFPLVIHRDQRSEYIAALEAADHEDLGPLVRLFGQNARRSFARALALSEDTLQDAKMLPQVVDDIVNLYRSRRQDAEQSFLPVENLAESLAGVAASALAEISTALQQKFGPVSASPTLRVTQSGPSNEFYYTMQIIETAKQLGYWANVSRRRLWVRLHLFDPFSRQKAHLVYSLHYLGKVNRGVMASTAFLYFPENKPDMQRDDNVEPQFGEMYRICAEPFYFSYLDVPRRDELVENYRYWLNDSLTVGLAEWARRL